jgi:hypothetical protein
VVAHLENPVGKTLRRKFFQNPLKFQKNRGPIGLLEGNDDNAVVLGKQPWDGVEEIAVGG